jgi:ribonuclease Z
MDDLELIILGSASGLPEANKTHASLALRRSDDIWLLDAGEGVCSSLLSSRLDPQNLRGIYITHCHPDHCVGIFMVLQYLHMTDYQGRIDIYLPGGAIDAFQGFMDQLYFIRGVINPRYELRPLEASHGMN